MNARDPKLTLRLSGVLQAMATRHAEKRPIGFWATVYQVPRPDLQAWCDEFNKGSAEFTPARLDQVRHELGLISERRATAPAKPLPKIVAGPGPNIGAWLEAQSDLRYEGKAHTQFVRVTPAIAERWLKLNTGNRNPSRSKIRRFAAAILSGQWRINGETVKFSKSGRLLDGQSRLQAVIEAQTSAVLEVRGGLEDEVQQSMDCGQIRAGTHALEMLGEKDPGILSPALRLVFQWENGTLSGGSGKGRMSVLENLAIPALLERHKKIRSSVSWAVAHRYKIQKIMTVGEAVFFHHVFGLADAENRDHFFDELFIAGHPRPTGPLGLLRDRLEAQGTAAGRLEPRVRMKLIVKTWNAEATGQKLKELTLTPREGVAPIHGVKP